MANAQELKELLDRFRSGPGNLERSIDGLSEAQLEYRPAPGKWSIREIILHLCDSEIAAAYRIRCAIGDDNPTLTTYDQDKWAARLNYGKRSIHNAVELFRMLRKSTAELFVDMDDSIWDRSAIHPERGQITVAELIRLYSEHCDNYVAQIRKIKLLLSQQE
ncbi:MAG: DinB family protein [Acidobacteriota bacterium]|nr:DinB family protein [Blastocatellia bacterium]MDW8412036.1 DinB family protein [Acidobacteriota bacterium]